MSGKFTQQPNAAETYFLKKQNPNSEGQQTNIATNSLSGSHGGQKTIVKTLKKGF